MSTTASVKRQEKPAVVTARETLLERYGYPALQARAAERLGELMEHTDPRVGLRAITLVNATLPKDTHGNSTHTGNQLVVVVQPWIGELSAKTRRKLQTVSPSVESSAQDAYPDMNVAPVERTQDLVSTHALKAATLEPTRQGPPASRAYTPKMAGRSARQDRPPHSPENGTAGG